MPTPARQLSLISAALVLASCATTHLVRPVGRGNTRVNVSAGGPIIQLGGAPIPLPLTSINVAHGLEDDIDVEAGVHPTALAFNPGAGSAPVIGMDLGMAWHPIPRHREVLAIGAQLYGFSNRNDAAVFANAWIAGNWRATSWLSLAGGFHNLFRLAVSDPEVRQRDVWSPTMFVQVALRPTARLEFELEARWFAFTQNGQNTAVAFYPIGQLGALGVLIGASYTFGAGVVR